MYLDSATKDTGALRVIPGSHKHGSPDHFEVLRPRPNEPDFRPFGLAPTEVPCWPLETEPGDVLAVPLLDIAPGRFGYTSVSPIGFVSDHVTGVFRALWRLNRIEAVSDDVPGVGIPNASFPGIVTVLPGREQLEEMLSREAELFAVGGAGFPPYSQHASPASVCGPGGSHPGECLRTLPPREHGGNLDIRYLQVGVTVYLPCYLAGCGLAIGDPHFAQGDGEVSGTAIEMDADFTVTTRLITDGPVLARGPHFEGPYDHLRSHS